MTSISSMHVSSASLQYASLAGASGQGSGDFGALMDSISAGGKQEQKKTYSAGSLLNIDWTSFEIDGKVSTDNSGPLMGFINDMLDKIRGMQSSQKSAQTAAPGGFTSEFQSVFGTDGPLFDFISVTTQKMGLSAEQNLALQNIAINNKDATSSTESIAKIHDELQAAGIV